MAINNTQQVDLQQIKKDAAQAALELNSECMVSEEFFKDLLDGAFPDMSRVERWLEYVEKDGDMTYLKLGGQRILLTTIQPTERTFKSMMDMLKNIQSLDRVPESALGLLGMANDTTNDQLIDFANWMVETYDKKYPTHEGDYKLGDLTLWVALEEGYPANLVGIYVDLGWGRVLVHTVYGLGLAHNMAIGNWDPDNLVSDIQRAAAMQSGVIEWP